MSSCISCRLNCLNRVQFPEAFNGTNALIWTEQCVGDAFGLAVVGVGLDVTPADNHLPDSSDDQRNIAIIFLFGRRLLAGLGRPGGFPGRLGILLLDALRAGLLAAVIVPALGAVVNNHRAKQAWQCFFLAFRRGGLSFSEYDPTGHAILYVTPPRYLASIRSRRGAPVPGQARDEKMPEQMSFGGR
jgi:hypothetical protein